MSSGPRRRVSDGHEREAIGERRRGSQWAAPNWREPALDMGVGERQADSTLVNTGSLDFLDPIRDFADCALNARLAKRTFCT